MEILLASPRGFCAGVNMAVSSLELAIKHFGPPIYVYHEIVHNQYVVRTFRDQGAVFVNSLDEIPEGSTVLFSAHGVSPEIREHATRRKLYLPSMPLARSLRRCFGSDQICKSTLHNRAHRT